MYLDKFTQSSAEWERLINFIIQILLNFQFV